MRARSTAVLFVAVLAASQWAVAIVADQPRSPAQDRWPLSGMSRWPANAAMPRHQLAMLWGVPAPYAKLINPLPPTKATVDRGAQIYTQRCIPCHGVTGQGDGEAGRKLSPPPGNLAWLSRLPLVRQDAFMYWTIAEGGAPLGSGMPSFKLTMSTEEIWVVIAYIQARLPQPPVKAQTAPVTIPRG